MKAVIIPSVENLFNPVLNALRSLGGSASIQEIYDTVSKQEAYSEDILSILHDPEKGTRTEIQYRLAWARTYLRKYGLLENSSRGVWSLLASANQVDRVDPRMIVSEVRNQYRPDQEQENGDETLAEISAEESWKQELYRVLTKEMDASAFERLVQRLLREAGFTQVEVTGRTGDGGIDGKGIAQVHGLLSFHVLFQCKKYSGAVGAGEIRDFRGAMVGRTDKGLFLTTGTFTPAAVKEATRDGAPAIDLIDGEALSERLRHLKLGVQTTTVEVVTVDVAWFRAI